MDMLKYAAMKAAGTVKLVAVGPDTVASFATKYDPETGKPTTSPEQFNLAGLDEAITGITGQLDALKAFRADVASVLAAQAAPIVVAAVEGAKP
jgi:hypothetical protein